MSLQTDDSCAIQPLKYRSEADVQVEELEMQMAEHLTKQAEEKKRSKAEEEEEAFMKEGKEEDAPSQEAQSEPPCSR